ncbi:hypothetical protein R5R35_002929 [Gryllus longicercus]|uniref:C2H2-type domain-containing protein n=1 Tax=Gryllus longicercus TaxID=2509291 RepID=A0AAN9VYK0_9ORTH
MDGTGDATDVYHQPNIKTEAFYTEDNVVPDHQPQTPEYYCKVSAAPLPPVQDEPEPPKRSSTTTRSKPQSCKVCGKTLSSASSYYVHMKLHSGSKPFHCTVCEASFCRKPYLEVHMRTHTGEKPFQCDLCMKRFTQKSSLNTHKRVHTGERPYACDVCHKRFAVKSYVTAHRWSHIADKPLACERCGLTFTAKSQFALHVRTHAAAAGFECRVCGRAFVRDSYLIRHHNRVHRDPNTQTVQVVQSQPPVVTTASSSFEASEYSPSHTHFMSC